MFAGCCRINQHLCRATNPPLWCQLKAAGQWGASLWRWELAWDFFRRFFPWEKVDFSAEDLKILENKMAWIYDRFKKCYHPSMEDVASVPPPSRTGKSLGVAQIHDYESISIRWYSTMFFCRCLRSLDSVLLCNSDLSGSFAISLSREVRPNSASSNNIQWPSDSVHGFHPRLWIA